MFVRLIRIAAVALCFGPVVTGCAGALGPAAQPAGLPQAAGVDRGGAASDADASRANVLLVPGAQQPPPGHLYVGQFGAVLSFPLVNGIPAQAPDHVLDISGEDGPEAISAGADGSLYESNVSDTYVLPPGATELSQATRVIHYPFSLGGVVTTTLDRSGYLYVSLGGLGEANIAIYRPNVTNNARPIKTIPRFSPRDLAIGRNRYLYADFGGLLFVFTDVKRNPQQILRCGVVEREASRFALDTDDHMYLSIAGRKSGKIAAVTSSPFVQCPPQRHHDITAAGMNQPGALAISGGYLYVVDDSPGIFVLDPTIRGAQTPIAVVSGSQSMLGHPYLAALGP